MACRPKHVYLASCRRDCCQRQIADPKLLIDNLQTPNTHPTASAYAVAPVPPSRRGTPSSGNPAATASRRMRSRASLTRSEKVVSATNWRSVKRSAKVVMPYCCTSEARARCQASSVCGVSSLALHLCATDSCSRVGDKINPAPLPFSNDSHQTRASSARLALRARRYSKVHRTPDIRHRKLPFTSGQTSCPCWQPPAASRP